MHLATAKRTNLCSLLACAVVLACEVGWAQQATAPTPAPSVQPPQTQTAQTPTPPTPANAGADKIRQQINNQVADMVAMAQALKAEVGKSTKDELSVAVVRKAASIEELAHRLRTEIQPALASGK